MCNIKGAFEVFLELNDTVLDVVYSDPTVLKIYNMDKINAWHIEFGKAFILKNASQSNRVHQDKLIIYVLHFGMTGSINKKGFFFISAEGLKFLHEDFYVFP